MIIGGQTYTVERFAYTNVKGRSVKSLDSSFGVFGSLQPLTGRQRHDLPEGVRARGKMAFYVPLGQPELVNVDLSAPRFSDILVDDRSQRWEVMDTKYWPKHSSFVDHIEYLLKLEGADE